MEGFVKLRPKKTEIKELIKEINPDLKIKNEVYEILGECFLYTVSFMDCIANDLIDEKSETNIEIEHIKAIFDKFGFEM